MSSTASSIRNTNDQMSDFRKRMIGEVYGIFNDVVRAAHKQCIYLTQTLSASPSPSTLYYKKMFLFLPTTVY
jgi:hypothetical protein